ncbi:MAG TPA: methylmalonyl-CoA mutase family protein, partial [Ignavibacteriaceae bacterium]
AAYRYQRDVESKEKYIVGVNEFIEENEKIEIPILTISPDVEIAQRKRLAALKQSRSQQDVDESLVEILAASENGNNLMPIFVKAAHNNVTLGEMVGELKKVFGTYEEVVVF